MSFFEELKRRNVFKVAVSYAIVAWIVLQVADTTFPALNIPAWVLSLLTILFLLGFPLALFLAWAFEMTPNGIKLTKDVTAEDSIRAQTGQKMNYLVIGGLVVLLLLVVLDSYVLDGDAAAMVPTEPAVATAAESEPLVVATAEESTNPFSEKSVAVLPFTNLSDDAEQEYFSDGLTDELINKLSQVNDLQVTGRNSSFFFKGRNDELKDIGQQLGVAHVLQGSVRKSGEQLRITAQLLDVGSNANLWSQNFDVQLSDIFMVQDEISTAVTTALSVTLRAGEFSQPGMTGNVEAYDEFIQGRKLQQAASDGTGSWLDAIAHLEKATELDPDFVRGWLALESAYASGTNALLPPSQTQDFAARRSAALGKVEALMPEHPALVLRRAARLSNTEHKYAEAEQLLLPLLENAVTTNASVAGQYSQLLWKVGRVQEALKYAQQQRRLEPLQAGASWLLASQLLTLNRRDEALAEIERGLPLAGGDQFASGLKFLAAVQGKDKAAALETMDSFDNFGPTQYVIAAEWRSQGDAAALTKLRELVTAGDYSQIVSVVYREWAVALGDPQLALDLLTMQTNVLGDFWLPLYDPVRQLPDFKDWVRDHGLLDYWRSTGNWGDYCRPVNDDFECM